MGTNTAGMLLIADGTNFNPTAMSGDITIDGTGATAIGDNKVVEADLKAVDTASDEECLTYETTTGDFEWQSCAVGSMTSFTAAGDSGGGQASQMVIPSLFWVGLTASILSIVPPIP